MRATLSNLNLTKFAATSPPPPSRWLPTTRQRLGTLFYHGTLPHETTQISSLCQRLTKNWRTLLVPGACKAGMYKHHVQWGDMDVMGHVNNVVYARWAESGRVNWVRDLVRRRREMREAEGMQIEMEMEMEKWSEIWTSRSIGLILAGYGVEFKFPVEFPDRVSVYHKLAKVGEDSFVLDATILSEKHQRVAARCHENIVVYNYKPSDPSQRPGKTRIPEYIRSVFNQVLDEQREAELQAADDIREIDEEVEALERAVLGRKEMK